MNTQSIKIIEFFLNVFTEFSEFSDKKNLKKIAGLKPTPSCVRDGDSTIQPQTQLTEKTVKFILIHASVDSLNSLISVKSIPFRENPNKTVLKHEITNVFGSEMGQYFDD